MAPLLALLGLVLIGGGSLWALTLVGSVDEDGALTGALASLQPVEASSAPASGEPGPNPVLPTEAPEPSLAPVVVVAPPGERPDIKGTILFSRGGNIWSASGTGLRQLTSSKDDKSPTWSPDGKHIYYTHTLKRTTSNSRPGGLYTLFVPDIWRMNADGSKKKRVYSSLIRGSGGLWFSHVYEPDVSPDGKTLAVVSDGPNGDGEAVVLHLVPSKGGRLKKVAATSVGKLGHNDPEWSPNGKQIAYTMNRNAGTKGVPVITIHTCKNRKDCSTGKSRRLRPGYGNPSWSPDGSWLAVEATRGLGRDIAIINSNRGAPRIVLTDDGNSFAPVVSPDGDQIAYLHRDGLNIDLRVMTLDIADDGKITLVDDRAVTTDGAIDGDSPPAWHIPRDQLKATQAAAEAAEEAAQEAAPSDAPASESSATPET